MKNLFTILLFLGLSYGQTYFVGDTIDNFTLDICENGEGVGSITKKELEISYG